MTFQAVRGLLLAGGFSLIGFAAMAQAGYQSTHTGNATFYGYGGGGNCSFPTPDSTLLTAAMNTADYNGSQACGAYVEVTNLNNGKKVVVRIDDQCPNCAVGHIDLAQTAFAKISDISAGIVPITWKYVDGPATTAKLMFKEGSSIWWAGIQVRDHRNPVASVAYRRAGSGSSFASLVRQDYNYFLASSGMGSGPYDLQITDVFGNVIVANSVALTLGTEIATSVQFPKALPTGNTDTSSGGGGSGTTTSPATTSLSPINNWTGGYCTNVNVTNPNTVPLKWTVKLTITGTVTSSWNATLSQAGTTLTASGVDWNATLAAGATTQFGYCAATQ